MSGDDDNYGPGTKEGTSGIVFLYRAITGGSSNDWSRVNNSQVRKIEDPDLGSLKPMLGGIEKKAVKITDEVFGDGLKYIDVYNRVKDSDVKGAHDDAGKWDQISKNIERARDGFSTFIANGDLGWKGASKDAAVASARAALDDFNSLQKSAEVMSKIVEKYAHTADETKSQIVDVYPNYKHDVIDRANSEYSAHVDEAENDYNSYAQTVMNDPYRAGVNGVKDNVPNVAVYGNANAPKPFQAPATTPGANTPTSSPSSKSASGSAKPASVDPKTLVPDKKTAPTGTSQNQSTNPAQQAAQGASDAAKGATDAAKSAADSAKNALDQGLQSLSSLGDLANGNNSLPEGALGLGPIGAKTADALKGLGGRTGGSTGGGRGASPSAPGMRPSTTPIEATKTAATQQSATTSRAGIGASGAAGGGGAPAAGARGAGADGKEHKSNKALRRVQNELFNDSEAVVSVLGAAEEKPSKDTGKD